MRLLIVDDNPKNAKLLEVILTPYGECEPVGGGKQAILAFEKAWNLASFQPYFSRYYDA